MDWVETKIRVRYQETDKMGVVYHSNYFVWFEVARTEMIRKVGITYKSMEKMGLLLPVVDVSCSYKVPAKYDDEVIIKAKVAYYNGLKIEFEYEAIRIEDGMLLATGRTNHVWIDNNYRPKRLNKVLPEIHQRILEVYQPN